jgi:hypothetical protein
VNVLNLFLGLAMPWVCGYVWLSHIESLIGANTPRSHMRVAGYGFFLGYAGLSFLILLFSALNWNPDFGAVILSLALITAVGIALTVLNSRSVAVVTPEPVKRSPANGRSWPERFLLMTLIAWIGAHLLLSVVDVLALPVFPWDAWIVWVYRAKAWFLAGGIVEFYRLDDWLLQSSALSYSMKAWAYPKFASVIPFWAATSLGHWSETLVNLPAILCGCAIGMGLYGQCREHGLGLLPSLLLAYLFFSTPLLGTHLSLAGYADVWMAGFAGLGFVALIRGIVSDDRLQIGLGLLMLMLGVAVKNEGLVWLLMAGIFLVLAYTPWKISLLTVAALTAVSTLMLVYGVSSLDLPFLGVAGVVDQTLILPFIGSFDLVYFDVWYEFFMSFFAFGSWNLTWVLVLSSLLMALMPPRERFNGVVAVFMLMFITAQVFIFAFTAHGEWAVSYTAINRLPLHFLPALLFAAAVVTQHRLKGAAEPAPGAPDEGENRAP